MRLSFSIMRLLRFHVADVADARSVPSNIDHRVSCKCLARYSCSNNVIAVNPLPPYPLVCDGGLAAQLSNFSRDLAFLGRMHFLLAGWSMIKVFYD